MYDGLVVRIVVCNYDAVVDFVKDDLLMVGAIIDVVVVAVIFVIKIGIVGIDDSAQCPFEFWLFVGHNWLIFGDGVDAIDDVVGDW